MELMLNEVLGGFELLNRVGAGGMGGEVWLATHPRYPGRQFAVKRIREGAVLDPESLESEKRGAELQKRLAEISPQVPSVYAIGQEAGYFYVAMEYVEGTDLATLIADGRLEERRAARIAIQLCRLLEQAEKISSALPMVRGVVHGDIKPENIRLQDGDEVRVLDFGIAKSISSEKTHTINVFGSVPYLSPERARDGKVDNRADLWAVAVVLYKMVQGRNPYGGETTEALLESMRERRLAFPVPISRDLETILRKALHLDQIQRYNSAASLRMDLEAFCSGGIIQGQSDDGESSATRRTTGLVVVPAGEESHPSRRESGMARPRIRTLLRILVLVVLAVIVWVWLGGRQVKQLQQGVTSATSLKEALALKDKLNGIAKLVPEGMLVEAREQLLFRLEDLSNAAIDKTEAEVARMDEGDWELALDGFKGVLELGGEDDDILSRVHYCKAQLSRLQGMAKNRETSMEEGGKLLQEAIEDFRQAEQLSSQPWPQPYLGEAQILALSPEEGGWASADDVRETYEKAEKSGHKISGGDKLAMGLCYLREAEEHERSAMRVHGTNEELEFLLQAKESVDQAREYLSLVQGKVPIPPEAMRRLADIQCRISQELLRFGIDSGGC
jgi:tetratricopeptide (TPR) repeat protein